MPRRAPEQVFEHRVTLGNYERTAITEFLEVKEKQAEVATFVKAAEAGVYVIAAAGISFVGYQTWLIVNNKKEVNPIGGTIADTIRHRLGLISSEEYEKRIYEDEQKLKERGGTRSGAFLDWLIYGNDDKFFFWDK
tara:strand:- start:905 stop:1312 length:408 start_codon:yes stop_codon:yes gene_type:complete